MSGKIPNMRSASASSSARADAWPIGAAKQDVLADRQARKYSPAFGHMGDAQTEDRLRRWPAIDCPRRRMLPDCGFSSPEMTPQRGALARAVGAEQGHDFAFVDVQSSSPAERGDFAVSGDHVVKFKQRHGPSASPR